MERLPLESRAMERKENPKLLYHASAKTALIELIPRKNRTRDPREGPVIFATPDKAVASFFLIENHNDSWTHICHYGEVQVVLICSNREEFIAKDRGGTIYELPSDSFSSHPDRGMGDLEWTSRSAVKPTNEHYYPSTLEAMLENGVQVYFVDRITFDELTRQMSKAEDHGFAMLTSLTSENEFRGATSKLIKKEAHPD